MTSAPLPPAEVPPIDAEALRAEAEALVRLMEAELKTDIEPLRAARLHYELATTAEEHLQDLARAAKHYQQAIQKWPEHIPSLRAARRVLVALGRGREALPLCDAEVRVTRDPMRRARVLFEKASLLEHVLDRADEARAVYRDALELDGDNVTILKALWRCERRHEEWPALAVSTESLANAVTDDPEYQAALIAARAYLAEVREGDPTKAADLYEAALELDLRAPGAISSLKRLCHDRGRWTELVKVIRRELELSSATTVRVEELERIAQLAKEHLGDLPKAIEALEAAVGEAPSDPRPLAQLCELYSAAHRHDALATALEQLFDLTAEHSERLLLAHRIGHLYETFLDRADQARRWYETALSMDPCFAPARDALGGLYERQADWASLIQMLTRQAESSSDDLDRALAYARIGEVLEAKLRRPDEAAAQYDRALGLAPDHESSFKALTRLHAAAGRWLELAELYRRKIDRSPGQERAIAYLFRLGALCEDRLGDPAGAMHAYRRVLQLVPDHLGAIQAIQRAAGRAGEWRALLEMLEREVKLTASRETKISLLCRAAEVCDVHLGDPDAAIQRLQRVLELEAANLMALDALVRIYQRAGRWDELLDTYKAKLQHAPPGLERARLVHKMGELCETHLGRETEAAAHYRQALALAPDHKPSYDALVRLLTSREAWSELVKLIGQRLDRVESPAERGALALAMGRLYEERLGSSEEALAAYGKAIEEAPQLQAAYDGRTRLLSAAKRWPELADNLARLAESTPDLAIALDARLEEGQLRANRLSDPEGAARCFEWILEQVPGHRGALLALEELRLASGDLDEAISVQRRQAEALTDRDARVAALRELCRLELAAGRDDDAERTARAILDLRADDEDALETLAGIAARRGDDGSLVRVVSRLASATNAKELEAMRMGRVAFALERQGDPNVLSAFRAALALDPECLVTARGFTRAAQRSGEPDALREAAFREAVVTRDRGLAVRLLDESASIRLRRNDLEGAVVDLEKALDLDPANERIAERLEEVLIALDQVPRLIELLGRAAEAVSDRARCSALHLECAELWSTRLRNLPAAVASARRALAAVPNSLPALTRLAADLEANQQWAEAVEAFGKVATLAREPTVLVDANLRIATICDERLGDADKALASLRAVLDRDPQNADALLRRARLEAARGSYDVALDLARGLLEAARDDAERAAALLQMADIEGRRGRQDECAGALLEAVGYEGAGGASDQRYRELIEGGNPHASWTDLLAALSKYAERASAAGLAHGATHRAVAAILLDHLGRPDEAISALRSALGREPADVQTGVRLASLLLERGQSAAAIDEVRRILQYDVTSPDAWRVLSRALEAEGDALEASAAAQPLRLLGAETGDEVVETLGRTPRAGMSPPAGTGREQYPDLALEPLFDATTELVAALEPTFAKLYPADPGRYGLSRRDRISSRAGSPLRAAADRIGLALGSGNFEYYITQGAADDVSVELGKPPALFLPEWAESLDEPALVFLVARPLIDMARGAHAVHRIPQNELTLLLAGAAYGVDASFGRDLAREAVLEDYSRKVAKATPRRQRKAVAAAAERYAEEPSDIGDWIDALRRSAARKALLLADDLVGALEVAERTTGVGIDVEGIPADLVRFWVSPTAAKWRAAVAAAWE